VLLNKAAKKARLDELAVEIKRVTNSPTMSNEQKKAFFETAETEIDEIRAEFKAHDEARKWSFGTEAGDYAMPQSPQSSGGYVHLPSPADATPAQWKALTDAMRTGTPFRTEVMPRPSAGMSGSIAMKTYTPALESGITSSFTGTLPAIMSPFAVGMAYDPLDLASLWPAVSMPGPSATQIVHSSNTNEATIVGEGAVKPELGPGFTVNQITPSKVAVTVSTSYEALMDTDLYQNGSFANFLPTEATNSYLNKRSDILLNAVSGTAGATFSGLLQTSGVLTQSATGLAPLDALSMGFVAIRNGTAKADPDLVIMSPNTLGALRRLKNADGNYLLELLSGPLNLSAYGQPETRAPASGPGEYFREAQGTRPFNGSLWGAEIAVSTHIADGEAAVVSIKGGGGLVWIRSGLELFFNPGYGDVLFQNNLVAWRVESRLAFNVPRPSAVCLVSNLPTS
jgi:HK97 family phage major capsid protein